MPWVTADRRSLKIGLVPLYRALHALCAPFGREDLPMRLRVVANPTSNAIELWTRRGESMADVFVSYDSEDRARVESLVQELEAAGLEVWWDRQIEAGESFDRTIEKELASSSCVLVVWSKNSVDSDWVREEAGEGQRRGILIPVQIDECQIPLGFRRVQAEQLIGWPDDSTDAVRLVSRIGALLQKEVPLEWALRRPKSRRRTVIVGSISVLVVLLGVYLSIGAIIGGWVMSAPARYFGEPVDQQLGVATSSDGTQIAYALSGDGPPVVYVLGWMTHLEMGFNSPVYDNEQLVRMTSRNHRFLRYDGRGFGMSQRNVDDFSLAARVADLKAVVDDAGFEQFHILAASSGGPVAVAYTAQHPDKVTGLVLGSSFASNSWVTDEERETTQQFFDLVETSWDIFPPVSDMFANMTLAPTGSMVEQSVLGSMLRRCCSGPNVAEYFRVTTRLDVRKEARQIDVPTLVIHARDDQATPLDGGKELASLIRGVRFEIVEGGHREGTASTAETRQMVLDFFAEIE